MKSCNHPGASEPCCTQNVQCSRAKTYGASTVNSVLHTALFWRLDFPLCGFVLLQDVERWPCLSSCLNIKSFDSSRRPTKEVCDVIPYINTFAASYLNTQGLNNSCLKSPTSTLVDLTFQSRALLSFSLSQLRNLSL